MADSDLLYVPAGVGPFDMSYTPGQTAGTRGEWPRWISDALNAPHRQRQSVVIAEPCARCVLAHLFWLHATDRAARGRGLLLGPLQNCVMVAVSEQKIATTHAAA